MSLPLMFVELGRGEVFVVTPRLKSQTVSWSSARKISRRWPCGGLSLTLYALSVAPGRFFFYMTVGLAIRLA